MDTSQFSAAGGGGLTHEEKTNAMLCHVLPLGGSLVPLGHIVAPMLVWMRNRDASPFVARHGRESVNFQLSATVYLIGAVCLWLQLGSFHALMLPFFGCAVAGFYLPAMGIAALRARTWMRVPLPAVHPVLRPGSAAERNSRG